MRRLLLLAGAVAALGACNQRERVLLDYQLADIDPESVVRVETVVSVDPADLRTFFADQPYRAVFPGVGYEVRDVDGSGRRVVLITHDATLGYKFTRAFTFTLLPPETGQAPPLVVLSRAVGTIQNTLGQTEPLKALFAKGAVVAVALTDQRCGGEVCAGDETCCDGACRRTLSSESHCGMCGNACGAGEKCTGGACRCSGGSGCPDGMSCCHDGCFDFVSDRQNCGGCGNVCKIGETCAGGACGCNGGAACGTGQICCAVGDCVAAAAGCPCGATQCNAPSECCNLVLCVDTASDNANCGTCNKACPAGLTCTASACRCNGVQVCTTGDTCCATGCKNTQNDPSNCGSCGQACAGGETCQQGQCLCGKASCGAGELCCGAVCVRPLTDAKNCGFCSNQCGLGEGCVAGKCSCEGLAACVGNQTCCPSGLKPGGCFDLANDSAHCGTCTQGCPLGQACSMGTCVASACNPACTNQNQCVGGSCLCNGKTACAGTTTCCSAGCKELLVDPDHCGACGKVCGLGELCCNGSCTPQDVNNCGVCGTVCRASSVGGGVTTPECCVCPTASNPHPPGTCIDGIACACPAPA